MKVNILRIILITLILGTFYVIFGFSSQDSKKSGGLSEKVTTFIAEKFNILKDKTTQERENIINKMEKVIRKLAHFSIYTVVGILLMSFISTYNLKEGIRIIVSLVIGIIYAISDEIHQSFVPGRSPQITDVMIDTMGVLLGILLVMLCLNLFSKIKQRTKKIENS